MFLSQVHQMSTNFDNFWHTDSIKDMWGALDFPPHLHCVNTLPC